MGNYSYALLQVEDDLYLRFVLKELTKLVGKTPMMENAWLLHYSEEVPESYFHSFTVK